MFKQRSKIFTFTVIMECIAAMLFLLISSLGSVVSQNTAEALTVGNLYTLTGVQTVGILVVIGAILNLVGLIYNNRETITIGTVIIISSLVADFLGSALLLTFQQAAEENVVFGTVLSLILLLIVIVILMIGFEDQLKLCGKEKKSK